MRQGLDDTTIILPTFNEESNLQPMVSALRTQYPKAKILISDGNSTDATKSIAEKLMKTDKRLTIFVNKGKIKGLTHDIMMAIKKVKTKFLVVMDCDFQHDLKKIGSIVESLRKGNDMVIGTRQFFPRNWPWHRKLMSWTAATIGRIRLQINKIKVQDCLSGFFGANTKFAQQKISRHRHRFVMTGYKILFNLLKVSPEARIDKVYYVFGVRTRGYSKIGHKQIFAYLQSLVK